MGDFRFTKTERLNSEKWIQELFQKGSSFHLYPFRVVFLSHPDSNHPHSQVLLSVSNRNFKRAVDRNTIKRRMREAYRLNKHLLLAHKKWLIGYIYVAKNIVDSDVIHQNLAQTLIRLNVQVENSAREPQN